MRVSELLSAPNRRKRLGALRLVRIALLPRPADHPHDGTPVHSPRDVYQFMRPFAEREPTEVFWILALDAQHRVIFDQPIIISQGILNSSLVHPREVFRSAIVAGAAAVILVHNHPSGDPTPSTDDAAVTSQLIAAGQHLDVPVHDHVIVGSGRYVSMAEAGLI